MPRCVIAAVCAPTPTASSGSTGSCAAGSASAATPRTSASSRYAPKSSGLCSLPWPALVVVTGLPDWVIHKRTIYSAMPCHSPEYASPWCICVGPTGASLSSLFRGFLEVEAMPMMPIYYCVYMAAVNTWLDFHNFLSCSVVSEIWS